MTVELVECWRDDEFDDAVYNDDDEDYADLLHPVQVLKNHLRFIRVNDFGPHTDLMFWGRLICVICGVTYTRVYTVLME